MVQILIILAFFAARLDEVFGADQAADTPQGPWVGAGARAWWGPALPFVSLLVMWLVFHAFTLRAGVAIDRTGRLSVLNRAHALMTTLRVSVLVVLFVCVLTPAIAWADLVRSWTGDIVLLDEVIIASPVLLMLVLTWWSIEPLERRVHDAAVLRNLLVGSGVYPPQSRGEWVWSQVRHQMLLVLVPIAMVLTWTEVVEALPRWLHAGTGAWWLEPLRWVGVIVVLMLTPLALRVVWRTVQMGGGELREQILATCRSYRVRVVGPLVWRTHGSLINAAILGMFYPFRYLLLSDAMLERMPREQLEVVLAHEIAHVRKRHMLWTAVAVFAVVMFLGVLGEAVMHFLPLPGLLESVAVGGAAVTSVIAGFLVFGLVSRRFEWDADAFAAAHIARLTSSGAPPVVNEHAVAATVATLQSVADLNGIPPRKFTFRHGSIAERQRRVAALLGTPVQRMPIARQVVIIKIAAAVLLVLALAPVILSMLLENAHS
ncbi:MAG: M48 family metalloprotease [Phycisphaerales bacterium]